MRFFLFAFFLTTTTIISAQNAVLDTELRRFDAMTRRDTSALRGLLHQDLFYLHSNGIKETKREHLTAIATGRLVYETMQRESATVRRYGKMALVNGKVAVKGKLQGNNFEINLLYSAVYRKYKGQWQLLNWQSTKI